MEIRLKWGTLGRIEEEEKNKSHKVGTAISILMITESRAIFPPNRGAASIKLDALLGKSESLVA